MTVRILCAPTQVHVRTRDVSVRTGLMEFAVLLINMDKQLKVTACIPDLILYGLIARVLQVIR